MLPCELEKLVNRHKAEGHLVRYITDKLENYSILSFFSPAALLRQLHHRHHRLRRVRSHRGDRRHLREEPHLATHWREQIPAKYLKNKVVYIFNFFIQAAWGGGLLMSRKYRALKFKGIERYVIEKRKNWANIGHFAVHGKQGRDPFTDLRRGLFWS